MLNGRTTYLALAILSVSSSAVGEDLIGVVVNVDIAARKLTLDGESALPVGRSVQLEELRPGMQVRAVLDVNKEWPRTIVSVELVGAPSGDDPPFWLLSRSKTDDDAAGVLLAQAPRLDAPIPPIKGLMDPAPAPGPDFIEVKPDGEILLSALLGLPVRNRADERIGSVADVLVKGDGRISAIVISVGGFFGLGDRRVALPMDKVELDTNTKTVVVDLGRSDLDQAPIFREVAAVPR